MLELTKEKWAKIDNPYGNSENIPGLIKTLEKTLDKEIFEELVSGYMYHQGSLYTATFAAFPYLMQIAENTGNMDFRLDTLLNLGVILSEYTGDNEMNQIFENSELDTETVKDIKNSFKIAFKRLNSMAESLMGTILQKKESDKRYFLLALATANSVYEVSSVLWKYSDNEEYVCVCPECEEEFFLWENNGKLDLYTEDPVFEKDQKKYPVQPAGLNKTDYSKEIIPSKNYEWLSYYIDKLNIESLKVTINYLFGTVVCPCCETKFKVFENLE